MVLVVLYFNYVHCASDYQAVRELQELFWRCTHAVTVVAKHSKLHIQAMQCSANSSGASVRDRVY